LKHFSRRDKVAAQPTDERLCFFSRVSGSKFGIPIGLVAEHGVEDDEELAHAGGHDELKGLSGGFEFGGEGFDGRVEVSGGERGHVEGGSDAGPTAPDHASPAELSAVAVERRHADQGRDRLSVELAEFRQLGHQRPTGRRPDAGHRRQTPSSFAPVVVVLDQPRQVGVEFVDLLAQVVEHAGDALADRAFGSLMQACLFAGRHLHQLPATPDELFDQRVIFRLFFPGPRPNLCAEAGQDRGVDPIGLRQATDAAREVANLSRIDPRHRVAGREQLPGQATFEAARSLDHDVTRPVRGQDFQQLRKPGLVGRDPETRAGREQVDVPMLLRNIDSDERTNGRFGFHDVIPSL